MRGSEVVVKETRRSERVYFSSIVAGELLYGFRNGNRYADNRSQLSAFLANRFVEFLPVTFDTADRFGIISAALKRKGTPIPTNDVWIAAHALQYGADLVSFDDHYSVVDGLSFLHLSES